METRKYLQTTVYESPLGPLVLGAVGNKLCLCYWKQSKHRVAVIGRVTAEQGCEIQEVDVDFLDRARLQLERYLEGISQSLTIPLLFTGTPFQRCVWEVLLQIPRGETISYQELAERVGKPRAVRAVANAVARNPLQLFVPCHRVVGKDGQLTGYAGGISAKEFLLKMEITEETM